MDEYERAIRSVQQLDSQLRKVKVKPVNLVATIGELLVLRKLMIEGIPYEARGGQAKCDVLLPQSGKCIEVKTSIEKENKKVRYHGWVVTRREGKRQGMFDFLICVAVSNIKTALENHKFYIFTKSEIEGLKDSKSSHHTSVGKKLEIALTEDDLMRWVDRGGVNGIELEINKNKGSFEERWELLRK